MPRYHKKRLLAKLLAQLAAGGCRVTAVGVEDAAGTNPAGTVDIQVLGTGLGTNVAPFTVNNTYTPQLVTAVNCNGYSRAHVFVQMIVAMRLGQMQHHARQHQPNRRVLAEFLESPRGGRTHINARRCARSSAVLPGRGRGRRGRRHVRRRGRRRRRRRSSLRWCRGRRRRSAAKRILGIDRVTKLVSHVDSSRYSRASAPNADTSIMAARRPICGD
jgi:hypothetical protein